MLEHELRPGTPGGALVLLLHGRGADRTDLQPVAAHFPASATVVLPDAPFPAADWGYGPGRAWYRYLGGSRPDPASYTASLGALEELLSALPGRTGATGPLVLGGFSQGGTISLGYALTHPGAVDAVVNFSGFLPDHPTVRAVPQTVNGLAVFWGHGRRDGSIPFAMAEEGRAALLSAGADLEVADYPIGHWIDGGELADAVRWLERRLS